MPDNPPNPAAPFRKSMEDAASVAGPLWLSFVFVLFYVLLTIASVSHKDMFLESAVRLPFPVVELPLLAFFWVGPLIVLLVHAYVLQHLSLLATSVRTLDQELAKLTPHPDPRGDLLPVNLFVRLVANPPQPGAAVSLRLVRLIAWCTVVVGPVLTLLFFELQFLPFHSEATTWWARIVVLLDLALLWIFWPRASLQTAVPEAWLGWGGSGWRVTFMSAFSVAILYVAALVATFPGEWLDDALPTFPLHETLISGRRNGDQRAQTLWPNRLFLGGLDLIDHKTYDTQAKRAAALPSTSMRGRHLERAILDEAQLGRMNFIDAHLEGASLLRLRAQGAWFNGADLRGAQLDDAELQGASFYGAHMAGATLEAAQLQGASIAGADLQAAWLARAALDGASLAGADLRRATLDEASLAGVSLKGARLQAASLAGARLEAASLLHAELWKTDFRRTEGGVGVAREEVKQAAETFCAGRPGDNCGIADAVETIVGRVPDPAHRAGMLARLTTPLSIEKKEHWEDASQRDFDRLKPMSEEARAAAWTRVACAGKGAPFVISMLVDTFKETKDWTRPTTPADVRKLVDALLGGGCTANGTLSPDLKMQLLDLRDTAVAPPTPEVRNPEIRAELTPPPAKPRAPR